MLPHPGLVITVCYFILTLCTVRVVQDYLYRAGRACPRRGSAAYNPTTRHAIDIFTVDYKPCCTSKGVKLWYAIVVALAWWIILPIYFLLRVPTRSEGKMEKLVRSQDRIETDREGVTEVAPEE